MIIESFNTPLIQMTVLMWAVVIGVFVVMLFAGWGLAIIFTKFYALLGENWSLPDPGLEDL